MSDNCTEVCILSSELKKLYEFLSNNPEAMDRPTIISLDSSSGIGTTCKLYTADPIYEKRSVLVDFTDYNSF